MPLLPAMLFALMLQDGELQNITELKFSECLELAQIDPASAIAEGGEWVQDGGGYLAQACVASGLAQDFQFDAAAENFTGAAREAEARHDRRAANFWAQGGNAYIAARQFDLALAALDQALSSPMLPDRERGEVQVDRARALVSSGRENEAVDILVEARRLSPENGQAWLFSATLARRLGRLEEAQNHITTAALLSPVEPAIALEAGNIAIAAGNYAAAKRQWTQILTIAPNSRVADTARTLLSELDAYCTEQDCPDAAAPAGGGTAPVQSR